MQSLPQKFESACANLLDVAGVSVPVRRQGATANVTLKVFNGFDADEKELPSATVAAMSGQEFPQDSGNFTLSVVVEIRSNADETDLQAHRQLCEDALSPLMQDNTASQLTSADDALGVMGISNRASRERVEDRTWVTEYSFDAYCCGQVLTA